MSTRQQATLPRALSTARRQFDQWRSQHRKHARLPQELWRQAAAMAQELSSKPDSWMPWNYQNMLQRTNTL